VRLALVRQALAGVRNSSGSSSASGACSGSATSSRRCAALTVTRVNPLTGNGYHKPFIHRGRRWGADLPYPGRVATVVVQRRLRRPAPEIPSGELAMPAPPELKQQVGSRWGQLMMVLPMLAGTVATAMMFAGRQGGAYSYVVGAVFGVSSLGMLATGFGSGAGQPRRAEMMAARRDYLRHLAVLRRKVREVADRQRDGLHYRHPDPTTLWSTVDSHRLWERRPGDADFAVVRVGTGPQALATPLVPPDTAP